MLADHSRSDLYSILVPLHHLLHPIHYNPQLYALRDRRTTTSRSTVLPNRTVSGKVSYTVLMIDTFLLVSPALADNTHRKDRCSHFVDKDRVVMSASCREGIPPEDLAREVNAYFPEGIALDNKMFGQIFVI